MLIFQKLENEQKEICYSMKSHVLGGRADFKSQLSWDPPTPIYPLDEESLNYVIELMYFLW